MGKTVLISCSSKKKNHALRARDLYDSPLFKFQMKYAISLDPDNIFILSAKYGLLDLDDNIAPYNLTLNKMTSSEISNWAQNVLKKLESKINLNDEEIIFLAGEKYRKFLVPSLSRYQIPLKGLGIGKQLKFLKEKINGKL